MRPINPKNEYEDKIIVGGSADGFTIIEFEGGRRKGTITLTKTEAVTVVEELDKILNFRSVKTITESRTEKVNKIVEEVIK